MIKSEQESPVDGAQTPSDVVPDECQEEKQNPEKHELPSVKRISEHPDYLCVAQFINSFGCLLGIPHLSLDTMEDGLESDPKNGHNDLYIDACSNAIERLLISLLRRCGILTNTDKLSCTLLKYFTDRDNDLQEDLAEKKFKDLSGLSKLQILKHICLNQFDENPKFKTDFNSQYGPDDLRWDPLGRDFDSSQYWFISDQERSHRLYRWKYPYTLDNWVLLTSMNVELRMVVNRVQPPGDEALLRQGKLGEVFKERISAPVTVEKPAKKPKKKNDKIEAKAAEQDADVEFKVRSSDLRTRKSLRNIDRKVYTEPNEENATSEEEEESTEHKEFDNKYKLAMDIAKSRKRPKKFLSISQPPISSVEKRDSPAVTENRPVAPTTMQQLSQPPSTLVKPGERVGASLSEQEALADSFINISKSKTPTKPVLDPKDPFAFTDDSSSRHSSERDDSSDTFSIKSETKPAKKVKENGQKRTKVFQERQHMMTNFVRKPKQFEISPVKSIFLETVRGIPCLMDFKRPKEAQDKCWKCQGEDDVEKMLFCDGCDLATYHMACLSPPILEVPDDDWFCPYCEQSLLYMNLKLQFSKLGGYGTNNSSHRRSNCSDGKGAGRPRKYNKTTSRNSAPQRYFTARVHTPRVYQHSPRSNIGSPNKIYINKTVVYTPRLITPSHSPCSIRYVTPKRSRPKIGQIERLAETARQVYDPAFDEETTASPLDRERKYAASRFTASPNSTKDSDSDENCQTIYPEDVDLLGSNSDSDSRSPLYGTPQTVDGKHQKEPLYGSVPPGIRVQQIRQERQMLHRQWQEKQRYTADDFLAEPTTAEKIDAKRQPNSGNTEVEKADMARSSSQSNNNATLRSSNKLHGKNSSAVRVPSKKNMDASSRSGNVVIDTSRQLDDQQRSALARWEEAERVRLRSKDAFAFDG